MPPNNDVEFLDAQEKKELPAVPRPGFKSNGEIDYDQEIKWDNVVGLFVLHAMFVYGCVVYMPYIKPISFLFLVLNGAISAFGITSGIHRYFSHKSYKAKLPLRVILMLCFATTGQNKMRSWVLDHRVHHKYSETAADPHNASRGQFFAHIGWLMKKKHPTCLENGKKIDMSDIDSDPVVQFFDRNFITLKLLSCFIVPICIMHFYLEESWGMAFFGNHFRYVLTLHGTWMINSIAHAFGSRPYDKSIGPTNNIVTMFTTYGEGWHNFHHTFPWDYRSSELGVDTKFNAATLFIEFFAWIGWAYDLKTASKELIMKQAQKKGDGTRFVGGHAVEETVSE